MSNKRPKIRKRNYAADVYDDFDQNFDDDRLDPSEINRIKFQNNEMDIVLDRKVNYVLMPGRCELDAESTNLLMSKDHWHSITVHHQGSFSKNEISLEIDSIANNTLFTPIAYCSGKYEDNFFVYNQPAVLQNFINKNLATIVGNRRLTFTLKLGVAKYVKGHINPIEKLDNAIADVIIKFREQRLDFSHFEKNRYLADTQYSFKNKACFEIFCDHFYNELLHETNRNVRDTLKILVFVGDNIKYLEPLSKFSIFPNLSNISLKNNAIDSILELDALRSIKSLRYLSVYGNPLVRGKESEMATQILELFPYLEKLDIKRKTAEPPPPLPPLQEITVIPIKFQSEVVKACHVDEVFKIEFPRKEYVKTFWSKVVIEHNGRFDSREVLDEMFKTYFEEMPCYPCYYKTGQLEDSFMLHMNFDPMNTLVQNGLKMKMPDSDEYVTFRLHLKCSTFMNGEVKWGDVIKNVVSKRVAARKLDLSNFRNDPEFRDVVVYMESTHLKEFVLTCASNIKTKIIEINMSNNGLRSMKGLELFKNFHDLFSLNLSHNKIESIAGFPENLGIVELSLNDNPLCNNFKNKSTTTYDYVKIFTTFCPRLEFLDGRKIDSNYKIIQLQNYFSATAAYPGIERFIEFFFKSFDCLQARTSVLCSALYRSDSMLSIRHGNETAIKYGHEDIKSYYSSFPYTEHDFVTMTIDTPLFNKNILIVVNGVLKQNDYNSLNPEDKLFTFTRTFMLRRDKGVYGNGRAYGTLSETFDYVIQNEIFHYESLIDCRIKNKAFKKRRATKNEIERVFDDKFSAEQEFAANLELFKQTTNMTDVWCQRFLEEANGDYEVALTYFIDFYKCQMLKIEDFVFT